MDNEAIRTTNLTKNFKGFKAVSNLSLSVRKGEIYGFLGLNGAGKTTTIRMLLGMIRPTSGNSYIFGRKVDAGQYDLWRDVGALVEVPYSYPELTVWENLEMIRRLRRLPDKNATTSIIERLHLGAYRNRRAGQLSLGNAQRLGLAKALIHEPRMLILDEPTNGLDPAGIAEVRDLLVSLTEDRGVTVFISSHILGEMSKLAARIGIIHDGCLVQEIESDDLEKISQKKLIIEIENKESAHRILKNNGYVTAAADNNMLEVTGKDATTHPEKVNKLLVKSNVFPSLLHVQAEDLESYFLRIIKSEEGKR